MAQPMPKLIYRQQGNESHSKRDRGTEFITATYRSVIRSCLSTVLLLAWTRSGSAQANSVSGAASQSADEQAKLVHNPLPPIWLLQFQQNNYAEGMPSPVRGNRIQSNLLFQPFLPLKLTDDWRVVFRPVLTLFNSVPYLDQTRQIQRTTGFGDTIFAAALSPRTTVVGSWLLALGPTFIFPTGGTELGQKKWQFGPFSIFGYRGAHFLAYVFSQQWFSIGGNGKKPTSQMSTTYSLAYFFKSGWTVGTQAQFSVDWEAASGNKVAFPIGLQVGYLFHVRSLPVQVDLQPEYYPVHPEHYGPKWNIQLQITPIIPILIPGQPND